MFKISYDKKITMVQGDTGVIRMRIHNYELSQGDEVRFAIVNKANPSILLCQHSDKKIVLEKQITVFEKDGSARIVIYPYDTEYLQPGKYLYEIQVKTKDGRIDTVVPLTSFTLMDGSIQGEFGQTTPSKPEPTPSEIELRFKRIENEIIPELGTRITNVENEIDSIIQDTNIIVKVGDGEEYTNINDALAFLSRKKLKYDKSGFKAEILLKSGFIIKEQIYVKNINLGYITISSEDEIVLANCSNFLQNIYEEPYGNGGYPVNSASLLTGYGNAVLPNINILVDLQNTNSSSASTHGVFLIYGASARICRGKGFINSGGPGVGVYEGSKLYATDTIIKNSFGNNISCFRGSYVLFRGGCATGSKNGYGVYLDNLSSIDCVSADFSDNAESGIWASGYSMVSANRSVINNCGRSGVTADESSIVDVHNSTICNNANNGIDCNSARVSCGNSTITGNNTAIRVSNGGIVDCKSSNLTGSTGNNTVYAYYGGIANVSKAIVQKIEGVNDKDLRVGYGGIIFAHGVTDSGYAGATPNVLSNNGIIFNGDEIPIDSGGTKRLKFKVVFSKYNSGVSSSSFPVSDLDKKDITINQVATYNGSSLTTDELSLIVIEKLTDSVAFTVNDETLAKKLAETCSTFILNVTLI